MKNLTKKTNLLGQQGFTLLELMIGTVVAVIVTAGAFSALTSSSKATRVNDQTAQTQQNGRLAMELLSHDIKMAGYGMTGPVGNCATAIVPGDNNVVGADTGPDSISMVVPITNASTPAWTLAGPAATTGPFSSIQLQSGAIANMGIVVGDTISIGGSVSATVGGPIDPAGPLLFKDIAGNAITIAAPITFAPNTPVYLLQCVTYQVMQAGGPNAAAICGTNVPCLARGISAPTLAGKIDCNGTGGAAACFAIAEGIEDLQLAYGCDGCNAAANSGVSNLVIDDQGAINNTFDAADFVSNSAWTSSPMTPDTIRLVRINLVAREAQNEQGFGEGNSTMGNTSSPLVIEDHNPSSDVGYLAATYNQFRRRVITRTVEVRNIGL